MPFKKVNLEKIAEDSNFESWDFIKKKASEDAGFLPPSHDEILCFHLNYPTADIKFGLSNFDKALRFSHSATGFELKLDVVFLDTSLKPFFREKNSGKQFGLACVNAWFVCPSCDKEYKVHCQPTRGLTKDNPFCKSCQKNVLHRCKSYRFNYESSMLESHGVRRPLQSKTIRDSMNKTMLARYGVEHSVHNPESVAKRDQTMMSLFGRTNYWQGINPWNEFDYGKRTFPLRISLVEKDFVDTLDQFVFQDFQTRNWKTSQKKWKRTRLDDKVSYGFLDYFVEELSLGIEFFGDYFHFNPEIYHSDFVSNRGFLVSEIWKKDEERARDAEQTLECKVIVVWEKDWRSHRDNILDQLRNLRDRVSSNLQLQLPRFVSRIT